MAPWSSLQWKSIARERFNGRKDASVAETSKALSRSIRHHPRIEKILEQFWELYEREKSADDCISKRAYVKVHLLIQRQILGITNPIDSLALASEDWARDSAKDTNTPSGYMGKEALLVGVFEIADLWTEEYDRKEYEEFLLNLYNPIRKKVKRKERSKASPDSPPLVTAEVRARNMAPLAPSQINARNTTLRLDAVGTSGKRGSEAYTSAEATARPKKPSKSPPKKVGPRSGAAHVPRFGSSYTLHAPHSEAQTMVVCGSSQQGPGAASLV